MLYLEFLEAVKRSLIDDGTTFLCIAAHAVLKKDTTIVNYTRFVASVNVLLETEKTLRGGDKHLSNDRFVLALRLVLCSEMGKSPEDMTPQDKLCARIKILDRMISEEMEKSHD